ncbi:MAG: carbohydrate binding domain-containing protein, partial [Pseudomonadota bacterium]
GTGMDAPTWRGAYDRWMITPQARLNIIDLLNIVNMDNSFPEEDMWDLAGSSSTIWQMVVQGSTGFSGAFARQITLNETSAETVQTRDILDALEANAIEGGIQLQGHGATIDSGIASDIALYFNGTEYATLDDSETYSRATLTAMAADGELVLTLTGHAGTRTDVDNPQPALWGADPIEAQTRDIEIPFLSDDLTINLSGRHIQEGASILVNGRRVAGTVACQTGALANCTDDLIVVTLNEPPVDGGWHFLQIQNVEGLFSNDMLFFSEQNPMPPRTGNIISSGGSFNSGQFDRDWNTVEVTSESFSESGGQLHVAMNVGDEPWHTQISHNILVIGGQEYTMCYRARADASRIITAYTDTNLDSYTNTSGQQFQANLTTSFQNFQHTFTIAETDLRGRIAFDLAQSDDTVHFDHIGMFEGNTCGDP